MKKLIGLVLVCGLVLAGCSTSKDDAKEKKEDATSVLNEALKITNKEKNFSGKIQLEMSGEALKDVGEIEMDIDFKLNNMHDEDKIEGFFDYKMSSGEVSMDMKMTLIKDDIYMEFMGQKIKTNKSEMNDMDLTQMSKIPKLKATSIKSSKMKAKGDKTEVTVRLSEKGMKEMFKESMSAANNGLIDDSDVEFKKMKLVYLIDEDGKAIKQSLDFVIETDGDESEIKMVIEYKSFSKNDISIKDKDKYIESEGF